MKIITDEIYDHHANEVDSCMGINVTPEEIALAVVDRLLQVYPKGRAIPCKHIKREGESCTLNNNCTYPDCPQVEPEVNKEEIRNAAERYADSLTKGDNHFYDALQGFKSGAEWLQSHPRPEVAPEVSDEDIENAVNEWIESLHGPRYINIEVNTVWKAAIKWFKFHPRPDAKSVEGISEPTLDEADILIKSTDYYIEATHTDINPINHGDASAFYIEGFKAALTELGINPNK